MSDTENVLNQAPSNQPTEIILTEADRTAKTHAIISYVLMLLGFWTGILLLVGGIWGIVKSGDAKGTAFESHYKNIKKTFWVSLILSVIGVVTWVFVIGMFIVLIAFIYTLVKVIMGLAKVTSNKPY